MRRSMPHQARHALSLALLALPARPLTAQGPPPPQPVPAESAATGRAAWPLTIGITGGPGYMFGIALTHNQVEVTSPRADFVWAGARVMFASTLEWQPGIEAGYLRWQWQGPWDNRPAGAGYLGIVARTAVGPQVSAEIGAGMYLAGDQRLYPGALIGFTAHVLVARWLEVPLSVRARPLLNGGILLPFSLTAGLAVNFGR